MSDEKEFETKAASDEDMEEIIALRKDIVIAFNKLTDKHRGEDGKLEKEKQKYVNFIISSTLTIILIEFAERLGWDVKDFAEAIKANMILISKNYTTLDPKSEQIEKILIDFMKGDTKVH